MQEKDFKSVVRTKEGGGFLGEAQRKREMSNCNQGCPGMPLVTLGILTHIQFLCVFVSKYLMYYWLVWTERATNCFFDIGCLLILSRIRLWSSPLAWAHWKIMRCGFIWFYSRMFVLPLFSLFSIILVFSFPPTRHMPINFSYGVTPRFGHAVMRFSKEIKCFKILARHAMLWVHIK